MVSVQETYFRSTLQTPFKLADWEQRFPLEAVGIKWESFVVRKPEWATGLGYGNNDSQVRYGRWQCQTSQIAAACLRELGWTFKQVEAFCAYRRWLIAMQNNIPNKEMYGQRKTTHQYTPCNQSYQELRASLMQMHHSEEPASEVYRKKIQPLWLPVLDTHVDCDAHFTLLDGQSLRLSEIAFLHVPKEPTELQKKYFAVDSPTEGWAVTVFHPSPARSERVMLEAQKTYDSDLKKCSQAQLYELLGKVFWYICEAKPWFWGDPSIAETIIRARSDLPPWKVGVIPWVKVMQEPNVEKFARDFHTFFDKG